jgi:hypothetical protein
LDLDIIQAGQRVAHSVVGDGGEAGASVALLPLEMALDLAVHLAQLIGRHPAALGQEVGDGGILPRGSGGAGLGELVVVDKSSLESQPPEEKVAVGVVRDCAKLNSREFIGKALRK